MIKINDETTLMILNEKSYIHGILVYNDGYEYDLGRMKNGTGNFLYDSKYVYCWLFNKSMPFIYDVSERCEVTDLNQKRLIFSRYNKTL